MAILNDVEEGVAGVANPYLLYLKIFAVAVVVVVIGFESYMLHRLSTELVTAKADVAIQLANVDTLQKAVNDQNAKMDQLKKDSEAYQQALSEAEKKANAKEVMYSKRIVEIANAKVGASCPAAVDFGINKAQDLAKQWNSIK